MSTPSSAAVQVWQINIRSLESNLSVAQCQYLTLAEQTKAQRIRHPLAQRNFIAGRTALRVLLGQATQQPPAELAFGTGPHGKPYLLDHPTVQFNLSHGGDWLAIALSHRHPLGVDLEPIRPRQNLPGLCRRYLSDRETQSVLAQPPDQASERFLSYWTCKEAYVKGLGVGLTQPLTTLDLTLALDPISRHPVPITQATGLDPGWQIYQWRPTPGYVAAIAIHHPQPMHPQPMTVTVEEIDPRSL